MELFYREVGDGSPLIILHGLYGSSDNWVSIAKQLGSKYRVILIDQRNHGNSPHSQSHTYSDLANDLYDLVRRLNLKEFHLMGHSMGGRVAMLFQTLYPNLVKSLVVVDIAPWSYSGTDARFVDRYNEHRGIVKSMLELPLDRVHSRSDADDFLSKSIPSQKLRQFLFKNLRRNSNGQFYWSINLPVIWESLDSMLLGVDVDIRVVQRLNVLFIKGADSDYIPDDRTDDIFSFYPKARLVTINNAGHWVHAEQPEIFVSTVLEFLSTV